MGEGVCPKKIKYKIVNDLKSRYSVKLLCSLLNVSRSGYYKWKKRITTITIKDTYDKNVKDMISVCYNEVDGIFGYRRIQTAISKKFRVNVNTKKIYRLMKDLNIKSKIRAKKPYFKGCDAAVVEDNILNRDFEAERPNTKLVTDITTIKFNNKKLYLSVVMDLFNREILTFNISNRNNNDLVIDTISDLIANHNLEGSIIHSDRGVQYTSRLYNTILKSNNIIQSMSRKGNCLDNACVECFFGHLKCELIYLKTFSSESDLVNAINKYIHFYNNFRFQKKLKNMAPIEYRSHVCAA